MLLVNEIIRPSTELIEAVKAIGAAKATSVLARMGIRNTAITGPTSYQRGITIAGPALTLQFMPKREDQYGDGEYVEPEKQLHRHVLYQVEAGDIVVVDARADMRAGIFGEMMLAYFQGKGGVGLVIDGCIRDTPSSQDINIGMWIRGVTPNFHTQIDLMPHAVNVPIACGGVYVMPGDIIVADDDGAVVVPVGIAEEFIEKASKHHEWEDFSKEKLMAGGDLRRYYPLSDEARPEYEAWLKAKSKS